MSVREGQVGRVDGGDVLGAQGGGGRDGGVGWTRERGWWEEVADGGGGGKGRLGDGWRWG